MPEAQSPALLSTQDEAKQRVNEAIQRLKERGALKQDACPQCGTFDWDVGFLAIPSAPIPKLGINQLTDFLRQWATSSSTWTYIPALTLACKHCGNTMIFNLKMAGLMQGE
jgi:hypothetical protein